MDTLLVDDSRTMRMRMRNLLEGVPGVAVTEHASPTEALRDVQARDFDLVLVDYHMPEIDGVTFVERVRTMPRYAQVPVAMITSEDSDEIRLAALRAGATDFIDKRMRQIELAVRVNNLVQLASAVRRLAEQAAWLDGEVEAAVRHMREREEEIIFRLSLAVEYRDTDTGEHTWRVARYSQLMALALGLAPDLCRRLYLAAPLHDVGKVAIPDAILLKPGKLDRAEFALVKTHTEIGWRVLGGSDSPLIQLAAEIAESHHERWDGAGYPKGLAGERIPLSARIVAVADVFDALTTERPYKAAMSFETALACIRAESGRHLDPACVAAFVACWPQILAAGQATEQAGRKGFSAATRPWARMPVPLRAVGADTPAPAMPAMDMPAMDMPAPDRPAADIAAMDIPEMETPPALRGAA